MNEYYEITMPNVIISILDLCPIFMAYCWWLQDCWWLSESAGSDSYTSKDYPRHPKSKRPTNV